MSLFYIFFQRYLFSSRAGAVIRKMARICWLATLIGVFSLILVASIMNGFNRSIRSKLLSVEPHLAVSGERAQIAENAALIHEIAGAKTQIYPFARQDIIIRTLDGRFAGAVAKGLQPEAIYEFFNRMNGLRLARGMSANIAPEQGELGPREVMLGSDLARELNLFEGDEVILIQPESLLAPQGEAPKFERMRVRSQFTTEFAEIDGKMILFRLPEAPLRFQSSVSGEFGYEMRLPNADDFQDLKDHFEERLPKGMTVESWADRNKALFMALRLEKVAMMTFLGLSVLITCFSLITVLVMLISQKRKEIGLLMSLGFSRKNTERLFLSIGLLLSSLGLFGGLVLGVAVSVLLDKYPLEILPDIYYDSSLPSDVSYPFVGGVSIFCLLIAFIAAYWPVRLYMKRSPAENLRPFIAD